MATYFKFLFFMGFGIAAMTILVKTAIDAVFSDWDPISHTHKYLTKVIRDKMAVERVYVDANQKT